MVPCKTRKLAVRRCCLSESEQKGKKVTVTISAEKVSFAQIESEKGIR
jgi:hypothetical protein